MRHIQCFWCISAIVSQCRGQQDGTSCWKAFAADAFFEQSCKMFRRHGAMAPIEKLGRLDALKAYGVYEDARACVAGTLDGIRGRYFLAHVNFGAFLERFEAKHLVVADTLRATWTDKQGHSNIWGICAPLVCASNPREVVWNLHWPQYIRARVDSLFPDPVHSDILLREVSRHSLQLETKLTRRQPLERTCRVFMHFNAFALLSAYPRQDPLFLGAVPSLSECLHLIESVSLTREISFFGHARMGVATDDTELICFGGPLSKLRDRSFAYARQREFSARPIDWLPERGVATIACAAGGSNISESIDASKGPCEWPFASWQCCTDADCHEKTDELDALKEDVATIEKQFIQAGKPRDWVRFWHIGTMYAQIAKLQHSEPDSVQSSAQAARWMELALQVTWDEPLVSQYQKHQFQHWHVLYSSPPARSIPLPSKDAPVVMLLLTVFGKYGEHCRATLTSILVHTTSPVIVFIAGDTTGVSDAKDAITFIRSWAADALLKDVLFFDVSVHVAFRTAWEKLPPDFKSRGTTLRKGGFDASDWARMFLDTYMPAWADKVVYVDIGDVLVLGDIAELWSAFDHLKPKQLLGAARMPWQLLEYKQWRFKYNASFVAGGFGFNSGVLLLDVGRLKDAHFTDDLIDSAWNLALQIYRHHGMGFRMMDILNLHIGKRPTQFFEIPCSWNYMPKPSFEGLWGAPASWSRGVWHHMISYPGQLAANHIVHRCPREAELRALATQLLGEDMIKANNPLHQKNLLGCRCGQSANVLHAAGAIKLRPWVSNMLRYWGVPFVEGTASILSWSQHGHGGMELFTSSSS